MSKKKGGCLRTILFLVVVYNVLRLLIDLFSGGSGTEEYVYVEPACDEYVLEDSETLNREHQREWNIPREAVSFCMGYPTLESVRRAEEAKRASMSTRVRDGNFWGGIYRNLVDQTGNELDYLADSLLNVGRSNQFDNLNLARLTVSFVQDIPYSYVIPSDCENYRTTGKPCLGNVPYGIISPYEFLHTLYGDCDTRAVLLYVLLQKMGFDPMIVVSDEYAHAMLALNIPAQGDYLRYEGKKYYFWETTATGWAIGMLPPESNNKNYWKIALVNES
jgi:hypothetical protein